MSSIDDRGFGDVGVGDRDVFQCDGTDPLTAGLDHVLGPIDQFDMAFLVYGRDVAGGEPAVFGGGTILAAEQIFPAHPRPARQHVAERDTIVRQFRAIGIDDLDVGAVHRTALFQTQPNRRLLVQVRGRRDGGVVGADRTRFGHAPGLVNVHTERPKAFDQHPWAGRSGDHQPL